jgi:hypothetical protein
MRRLRVIYRVKPPIIPEDIIGLELREGRKRDVRMFDGQPPEQLKNVKTIRELMWLNGPNFIALVCELAAPTLGFRSPRHDA